MKNLSRIEKVFFNAKNSHVASFPFLGQNSVSSKSRVNFILSLSLRQKVQIMQQIAAVAKWCKITSTEAFRMNNSWLLLPIGGKIFPEASPRFAECTATLCPMSDKCIRLLNFGGGLSPRALEVFLFVFLFVFFPTKG